MSDSLTKPPNYQPSSGQVPTQHGDNEIIILGQNLPLPEPSVSEQGRVQIHLGGRHENDRVGPVIQEGDSGRWAGLTITAPPGMIQFYQSHHKVKPSPGFVLGKFIKFINR